MMFLSDGNFYDFKRHQPRRNLYLHDVAHFLAEQSFADRGTYGDFPLLEVGFAFL